jgi:Zn-dependent protease
MGLFIAIGPTRWPWEFVLMLIPILLFHESGHYLAMRIFKYRNLRMFFIPLFGAAVSGRHYNIAGWKKVIVSLMGPVPGIAVGIVLGLIGLFLHKTFLIKIASLTLILNAFNLVPVLPFDGGWVFHSILFSRHYLLDTAFRALAGIAVIVGSFFSHSILLRILGISMLISLPVSYRLARITSNLRQRAAVPPPLDDQTIPVASAQIIIDEVKKTFRHGVTSKSIAQHTITIFETLNARPPNWLASAGLLTVHIGSAVAALLFLVLFVVGERTDLGSFARAAADLPKQKLSCTDLASWSGTASAELADKSSKTIIATLAKTSDAEPLYQTLTNQLPNSARVGLFGQSILITLPEGDEGARKKWFAEMQSHTTNLFVASTNMFSALSLACVAPNDKAAEEIEAAAADYFGAGNLHLIPPWSKLDARSTEARDRHHSARRTFTLLRHAQSEVYGDPAVLNIQKQMTTARRQGDSAEINKSFDELGRAMDAARLRSLEKVKSAPMADQPFIEAYSSLPPANGSNHLERTKQMVSDLGPLLGQLPLHDGKPSSADVRYSARFGSITRHGLLLSFNWMSFDDAIDGPVALAEWLCSKHCLDFKYAFHASGLDADLPEEE